jgi:isopenicillin N synthase-like dioxygenase
MYSTPPIIDFSRFLTGSAEDRKQVASEVDHALKTVGFFFLQNHGISQSRIANCFNWVRLSFLSLSLRALNLHK